MKKIILIGLILILSGCHTLTGALIGGGIGGVIGGGRGAVIGAAIGGGIGGEADIAEMKTAGVSPYTYGRSSYDYGYGAPDCSMFPTKGEQLQCERGRADMERQIQYERERRAYEWGRGGY